MTARSLRPVASFAASFAAFPAALLAAVLLLGCSAGRQAAAPAPAAEPSQEGTLVNLAALNGPADEFAAALSADCGTLLFTSNRPAAAGDGLIDDESRYGERVYSSSGAGLQWSPPLPSTDRLLTEPNAGAASFLPEGRGLLYAASYRANGAGGTDIWGPAGLPPAVNSAWWDSHPSLSASGTLCVFASDRGPEPPSTTVKGRRQADLFLARRRADGGWSSPERLPAPVNSDANDVTPHLGSDGNLYFASDRAGSLGYDIYRCTIGADGATGAVERLPAPVNSAADDLFPALGCDGCALLVTSNRGGGRGGYDLWMAQQSRTVPVRGSVALAAADGSRTPAADARVELLPAGGGAAVVARSDAQGRYEAELAACTAYTARAGQRDCYTAPEAVAVGPLHASPGAAPAPVPELVYRSAEGPDIDTWSDRIPCFVTGYWQPTTTQRYRELRERIERRELAAASFVNPDDYAYGEHLADIDGKFERIFRKIETTVELLDNGCMRRTSPLTITVVGYVDTMGLTRGRYPDETVRTTDADIPGRTLRGITIRKNDVLWGQDGNARLSHLRAYYTYREIDRVMRERSPRYAALVRDGRIAWKYCGGELPQSSGEYKADPDSRRFDIFIR